MLFVLNLCLFVCCFLSVQCFSEQENEHTQSKLLSCLFYLYICIPVCCLFAFNFTEHENETPKKFKSLGLVCDVFVSLIVAVFLIF